jgi:hypothetical protein
MADKVSLAVEEDSGSDLRVSLLSESNTIDQKLNPDERAAASGDGASSRAKEECGK